MSDLTDIANQKRPLSYVSWLQLYKKNAVSEQIALAEYNQYVHDWHTTQDEKATAEVSTVADLYRNLFREITLHFTTEEERRFLSNIDLNSKKDLDIAIPFFVKKLKQISQYFVAKREEAKQAKVKYNFNGSSLGLEKQIQFTIFNLISNQDFISQFEITTSVPSLSTVIAEMAVAVNGLYDITTTYFDQASGNNDVDPLPVLDLQKAIVELLASIPIALSTDPANQIILTADNEEILANVSRTDFQDLPYSEFLNAVKKLENISIGFHERLLEKYMGTQFYYVSTGSTLNNIVSGVLFSPTNDHANILNRYKPTQVTVPNDANLKTIQEIGSYFTPDKLGLLCFTGFTQDFQVDTTLLSANTIFVFPDPHIYGPGRGNTRIDQRSPIKHRENVTVIKADNSNGMLAGDIVDVQYHQKHFPYQSREETLKYQPAGISRSYDQIDFFTGSQKDIWANSDIYPVQPLSTPPFQIRIDDLVITDDIMTEWRSDIFGNEFALYKKVEPKRLFNVVPPVDRYSTKYEATNIVNTFSTNISNPSNVASLNNRQAAFGVMQVRSSHTPMVNNLPNVLSAVFTKYQSDTELMGELLSAVKFFDISNDILIVKTEHYIVMEKYTYSFTTGEYKSVTGKKIFLRINPFSYHINFIFDNLITIGADGRMLWDVVTHGATLTGGILWNAHATALSSVSSTNTQRQAIWNDRFTVGTSDQSIWNDRSTIGASVSTIWTTDSNVIEPIASEWAARVVANGGVMPSQNSIRAGSTFIGSLCSHSMLSKFKHINMMAPDNDIASITPLYLKVGSDPYAGGTGGADLDINGAHGRTTSDLSPHYWTPNFVPLEIFTNSNGGFTIYLSGGLITAGDAFQVECGSSNIAYPNPSSDDFRFALQTPPDGTTQVNFFGASMTNIKLFPVSAADMRGYFHVSRTALGTGNVYFANALSAHSSVATLTGSSGTPTNASATIIFADNVTGSRQSFSQRCISFIAFGSGLTSSESALLHTFVKQLRTTIGGGVFS